MWVWLWPVLHGLSYNVLVIRFAFSSRNSFSYRYIAKIFFLANNWNAILDICLCYNGIMIIWFLYCSMMETSIYSLSTSGMISLSRSGNITTFWSFSAHGLYSGVSTISTTSNSLHMSFVPMSSEADYSNEWMNVMFSQQWVAYAILHHLAVTITYLHSHHKLHINCRTKILTKTLFFWGVLNSSMIFNLGVTCWFTHQIKPAVPLDMHFLSTLSFWLSGYLAPWKCT